MITTIYQHAYTKLSLKKIWIGTGSSVFHKADVNDKRISYSGKAMSFRSRAGTASWYCRTTASVCSSLKESLGPGSSWLLRPG